MRISIFSSVNLEEDDEELSVSEHERNLLSLLVDMTACGQVLTKKKNETSFLLIDKLELNEKN